MNNHVILNYVFLHILQISDMNGMFQYKILYDKQLNNFQLVYHLYKFHLDNQNLNYQQQYSTNYNKLIEYVCRKCFSTVQYPLILFHKARYYEVVKALKAKKLGEEIKIDNFKDLLILKKDKNNLDFKGYIKMQFFFTFFLLKSCKLFT